MKNNRNKKLLILIFFILFLTLLLMLSVSNTIKNKRKPPSQTVTHKELSIRGSIISKDGFNISVSKKLFKATIFLSSLDMDKKELFVKLFSIYSDIPEKKIMQVIDKNIRQKKLGTIILSHNIDAKTAKNLKQLSRKLLKLKIFKTINIDGNDLVIGLDIIPTGEKRVYQYDDSFSTVVGYVKKFENKQNITRVKGINGIEKFYDKSLNNYKNFTIKGKRDVLSNIILNANAEKIDSYDGAKLYINIPLKLQKNMEKIVDHFQIKLKAKEIIASVMRSDTGEVLALVSSNRFDPQNITTKDILNGHTNINAISYAFEPGSVIKPLSISLVLQNGLVKTDETINAHNRSVKNLFSNYGYGSYKIGKHTIKDAHRFKKNRLTLNDILIYSSNIGTLKLAQRLTGKQFYDGFKSFGLSKKTGIDIYSEKTGIIHTKKQYSIGDKDGKDNIYKATDSYGHGITATFMQVLKAYTVFNNNGLMVTPRVVNYIKFQDNIIKPKFFKPKKVLDKNVANYIKSILIDVVEKGTGRNTKIKNLEVGGKTGTASIARGGKYLKKYNSSFFGFANDKNNKYTIGVTIREPSSTNIRSQNYYASSSAVPVFKKIVKALVVLDYLKIGEYR